MKFWRFMSSLDLGSCKLGTDWLCMAAANHMPQLKQNCSCSKGRTGKSHTFLKHRAYYSWQLVFRNPADFTQISPVKSTQNYKSKCFSKNSSVWWMQGGGFHPWNLVDFTLKSGRFHLWNLVDFTQISPVKSTQNYKSKCFSKNSSVWWMQGGGFHPWNLVDFTHEIWQISPRFHLWNPPKIIKASVSAKTLQFDECRVGTMTKDFMKSTGFHMKSAGFHVKTTWNPPDFKIMSFCVMIKYRSFVFRKTKQKPIKYSTQCQTPVNSPHVKFYVLTLSLTNLAWNRP